MNSPTMKLARTLLGPGQHLQRARCVQRPARRRTARPESKDQDQAQFDGRKKKGNSAACITPAVATQNSATGSTSGAATSNSKRVAKNRAPATFDRVGPPRPARRKGFLCSTVFDFRMAADPTDIGCCSCFSFLRKPSVSVRQPWDGDGMLSENLLKHQLTEDPDGSLYNGDDLVGSFYCVDDLDTSFFNDDDHDRSFSNGDSSDTSFYNRDNIDYLDGSGVRPHRKRSEDIIQSRAQNGFSCREILVKETKKAFRSEDENGNKMLNQYVHLGKIGSGSYGKVVQYRSMQDGKLYAVKVFNKPCLKKIHIFESETAMTDVLREVSIMKMLDHPNIVNLVEVIDDPDKDKLYLVLEYVEGKMVCDTGLSEATARNYLRDMLSGIMYLHSHNIIHGDIKPDNLLVTSTGNVKIGDFSVSQVFEDDDDAIERSPGTLVFAAPECFEGSTHQGRASDTWAVGVTLYCMIFGHHPFLGDTMQEINDKIVNDPVQIPDNMNPQLADLLQRLLCKDPGDRITLQAAAEHPWVAGDKGPVPEYICRCGFGRRKRNDLSEEAQ